MITISPDQITDTELADVIKHVWAFNGVPTLNELETKALVISLSVKGAGHTEVIVDFPSYFSVVLVPVLKQHGIACYMPFYGDVIAV